MTQQLIDAPRPAATAIATTRVLHVINGEHYAGAERVQDLLGLRLGQFGYRAGFACLKDGQFAAMRKCTEAPLYQVAMKHRLDFSPARRLARIVREQDYKLIHSHTARSAVIGGLASMLSGVPLVHHVHSPTTSDTTYRFRNWINSLSERLVLRRAKALIAVSEALGNYVRKMGFGVYVVPNGVPARKVVPPRDPAKTDWTLGAIALFRPRKGLEVLLESLADLRQRGLPVRLRAVGSFETPEYEAHIRQTANRLKVDAAIDWVGFTRDVDAELARIDLFVLPSLFGEGLPMVVLEAMSAGLAIVATSVPGVPEAVCDGINGLLVEPGNSAALGQAIESFVCGRVSRNEMGANALRQHDESFSDARMAADVAEVYDRVLSGTL